MRSMQALEGKLTAEEEQPILDAIEQAKQAISDGNLEELEKASTALVRATLFVRFVV